VQTPNDGYWKEEDPKIGDQIRDVGKVAHGDQVETFARNSRIPELSGGRSANRKPGQRNIRPPHRPNERHQASTPDHGFEVC